MPDAGRMAGIDNNGQVALFPDNRNRADVKGVPCGCLKCPDAPFAKNHVRLPAAMIYSAAFSHSSIADNPRLRSTGMPVLPAS